MAHNQAQASGQDVPTHPARQVVRSPAISPSRPLSVRRHSADLDTYVDMYGLSQDMPEHEAQSLPRGNMDDPRDDHQYLFAGSVDQELKNLQNLRRLSLDVSSLDPDVPSQNYKINPALTTATDENEAEAGNSSYWVPARIHPELAPQEWQSFVQKTGLHGDNDMIPGIFSRTPSKKGLARSKSILSRQVSTKAYDEDNDASLDLDYHHANRSQPGEDATDKEESTDKGSSRVPPTGTELIETVIPEESSKSPSDEPILVPPPGQILRRAARTGKAKGSYRKFAKPKPITMPETSQDEIASPSLPTSSNFGSEVLQLSADVSERTALPVEPKTVEDHGEPAASISTERKKSRNRSTQVVGSTLPTEPQTELIEPSAGVDPIVREEELARHVTQATIIRPVLTPGVEKTKATEPGGTTMPGTLSRSSDSTPSIPNNPKADLEGVPDAEGAGSESTSRPGLKRELSAASLTRAVMSGQSPTSFTAKPKSPPHRQSHEDHRANHAVASAPSGKKSAWGKLFSTEDKSKSKKEAKFVAKLKRTPSQEEKAHPEKENGHTNLFTSIFGGKKKEKEQTSEAPRREPTPTPRAIVREPQFYSRYPIQLERAIYRMAHLKLGNSRRPLFHQVLLSNFMYGYLALVGANSSAQSPSAGKRSRSQGPMQRSASVDPSSENSDGAERRDAHVGHGQDTPNTASNTASKAPSIAESAPPEGIPEDTAYHSPNTPVVHTPEENDALQSSSARNDDMTTNDQVGHNSQRPQRPDGTAQRVGSVDVPRVASVSHDDEAVLAT